VLAGQSPGVRDFLLRTAVLQRLSGPLCDAVTGRSGSARMPERIERDNLFLMPLDTMREWYRYHLLFGELLRHELQRSQPDLLANLHRRAYEWYRAEGVIPDAIEHAAAAGGRRSCSGPSAAGEAPSRPVTHAPVRGRRPHASVSPGTA
jgi:LuxR family transcriptional regulator, maltose regulon positive regulatory protein